MTPENDQDDATTLRGLRAEFPHLDDPLDRVPGHLPRLVGARSRRAQPLAGVKHDLDRFRRTLDRACWPF